MKQRKINITPHDVEVVSGKHDKPVLRFKEARGDTIITLDIHLSDHWWFRYIGECMKEWALEQDKEILDMYGSDLDFELLG